MSVLAAGVLIRSVVAQAIRSDSKLRLPEANGDRGVGRGVVRAAAAFGGQFGRVEFGKVGTNVAVRRQAIVAAVDLRDGQRDSLAGLDGRAPCPGTSSRRTMQPPF